MFDKTFDLSNHSPMIAEVDIFENVTQPDGNVVERDVFITQKELSRILWKKLKANASFVNYPPIKTGIIDKNGIPTGMTADILKGKYECSSDDFYSRGLWKNEITYFSPLRVCFVTRKEVVPITTQLFKIFRWPVTVTLLIFFIITIIVLSYLFRVTHLEVVMDIVRGFVGSSMMHQPTNVTGMLFFICIICSLASINTFFNSLLTHLLTMKSTQYTDIKNHDDLVKNEFTVFSEIYLTQFYFNTSLENKIVVIEDYKECLGWLNNRSKIACMKNCNALEYKIVENNQVHISKDEYFQRYSIILVRDNSPLRYRMEKIYHRFFENGITQHLVNLKKLQYYMIFENIGVATINLYQLRHTFYFTFVTYAFSILIFFIELIINHHND